MKELLARLGLAEINAGAWIGSRALECGGDIVPSLDPTTGRPIASLRMAGAAELEQVIAASVEAFQTWRSLPAPKRGEVVRQMGEVLRAHKEDLGALVTLEVGKILSEGLGEVQESIDMADLAVGMSRQLYGLSMHSERPQHRMYEQWHPLGPVAVITAFNFPNAVWAWNAMVALIAGDSVIWKPSIKAALTAVATHRLLAPVAEAHGLPGLLTLIVGPDASVGEHLVADHRVPLVSATGSTRMGKRVGQVVAGRMGRCLLELGGNNAIIVHKDADLELALRGIAFGAVGTAGQRCTTTRRILLHKDIADAFLDRLVALYERLPIGDPAEPGTLVGPLIDELAVDQYRLAIEQAQAQGGVLLTGGQVLARPGFFVRPTIIRARPEMPICREETFAPILYAMVYDELDQAIAWNNDVPQGLSSAIFTNGFREAERFLSSTGSDCGIANVNIGTSGAEIGGAFGGEKETGGGREAGSDSWKAYMRRQTCTLNWGTALPLAQGVRFDV